jgi:very-short-patch-repair endonuclease
MTEAEVILWSRIRPRAWPLGRFRRQYPIGSYIADFACPQSRLVVEVDGATHASDEERAHDARRDRFMAEQGWTVVRVFNEDVYKHLDDVLDTIGRRVQARERAPVPPAIEN